jgi:hypothetical protein
LAVGSCLFNQRYVFAQTDQTSSQLLAANAAIGQAFTAVWDAEKAGANVTDLLVRINDAAGVLANAENNYRTGYSVMAESQADSVLGIANQVTISAQSAKQTALASSQNAFWQTIAFTAIGASIFVLALSLVWRWFKRHYINSLSEAKPEVVS